MDVVIQAEAQADDGASTQTNVGAASKQRSDLIVPRVEGGA